MHFLLALKVLGVYGSRQYKKGRKNSLCLKHLYFKYCTKENLCLYSLQWVWNWHEGNLPEDSYLCQKKLEKLLFGAFFFSFIFFFFFFFSPCYFSFPLLCFPLISFYNTEVVRKIILQLLIFIILFYIFLKKLAYSPSSHIVIWNRQPIILLGWLNFIHRKSNISGSFFHSLD